MEWGFSEWGNGKKGNGESAKGEWCKSKKVEKMKYIEGEIGIYGPNVSKIPISATGCRTVYLCVVQLKGKHCRKTHCRNGVVDMFGHGYVSWMGK